MKYQKAVYKTWSQTAKRVALWNCTWGQRCFQNVNVSMLTYSQKNTRVFKSHPLVSVWPPLFKFHVCQQSRSRKVKAPSRGNKELIVLASDWERTSHCAPTLTVYYWVCMDIWYVCPCSCSMCLCADLRSVVVHVGTLDVEVQTDLRVGISTCDAAWGHVWFIGVRRLSLDHLQRGSFPSLSLSTLLFPPSQHRMFSSHMTLHKPTILQLDKIAVLT